LEANASTGCDDAVFVTEGELADLLIPYNQVHINETVILTDSLLVVQVTIHRQVLPVPLS
jgi:hypothetical protein